MTPTPKDTGKDTVTTNHLKNLELLLKQATDEVEKSKAGTPEMRKPLVDEGDNLEKEFKNLKVSQSKLADYNKTKEKVLAFQKKVKKSLAEIAQKAKEAEPAKIDVALLKYTKPKFAHNATNAGTLPKWTFQYIDTVSKKKGEVEITMSKAMTKDEPTAKKMMSDAAVAEVKKHYPKAEVKVNNASLEK